MVATHTHEVSTTGQGDAHDLTATVSQALGSSGLTAGVATVFVVGSTAGITTLEFESGVVHDLDRALQEIAPREADYRHHRAGMTTTGRATCVRRWSVRRWPFHSPRSN